MRLVLTCGICDFTAELDDCTAPQVELQWNLFDEHHKHTPEELEHYTDARAGWSPVDDEEPTEPGEDAK